MIAHFWLRPGITAATTVLGDTLARLSGTVRIGAVRANSGFCAGMHDGRLAPPCAPAGERQSHRSLAPHDGRTDIENRYKKLGAQFGLKGLPFVLGDLSGLPPSDRRLQSLRRPSTPARSGVTR